MLYSTIVMYVYYLWNVYNYTFNIVFDIIILLQVIK